MATQRQPCTACGGQSYTMEIDPVYLTPRLGRECVVCAGKGFTYVYVPDAPKPPRGDGLGHQGETAETKPPQSGSNESGLFEFGDWFVQHIWPLRMIEQAGVRLAWPGKPVRIVAMLAGAILLVVLTTPDNGAVAWPWAHLVFHDIAGDSSVLLALGIGAFLGWWAPTVAGALLALIAHLTGFAIGMLLIAGLLWVVYTVFVAGFGD